MGNSNIEFVSKHDHCFCWPALSMFWYMPLSRSWILPFACSICFRAWVCWAVLSAPVSSWTYASVAWSFYLTRCRFFWYLCNCSVRS